MKKIVLASHNKGKVKEFNELLSPYDIELVSQVELGVQPVHETGLTFIENAILKARHASFHTGLPALADDSGLEVDKLKGEPGIYSARYAGVGASDQKNMEKLLQKLKFFDENKFRARFRCVLVLLRYSQDPAPILAQGVWEGEIAQRPMGENGFGYDPIFFVPELNCTAAELTDSTKNSMSHRAKAFEKLISQLQHI